MSGRKSKQIQARNGEPMRVINDLLSNPPAGCFIWPFGTIGYPRIRLNPSTTVRVHRYICEQVNGPPPTTDHEASHICGRGADGCVSPACLVWESRQENEDRKDAHGTRVRGSKHGRSKLTEDQVLAIFSDDRHYLVIADAYGISWSQVCAIRSGRKWGWLTSR